MTDNEFLLFDRIKKIRSVIDKYGEDTFALSFSGGKDRRKDYKTMIIEKHRVGAHGRKTIYTICNSIAETGESRTDEIARFDTLELAAIVLRYLRGDSLSEADEPNCRRK